MNENNDSQMLTRIDAYVRDFAQLPDDTTLLCVLRLCTSSKRTRCTGQLNVRRTNYDQRTDQRGDC